MITLRYSQKVKLKLTPANTVVKEFENLDFVKYLVKFQPVKIIKWEGVNDGCKAVFKIWFLFWHYFKVKHNSYSKRDDYLFFIDKGFELPLGLLEWEHKHTVFCENNNTFINDDIVFKHRNKIFGIILYPILISPIFLRKILYPMYFNNNRKGD